ncbi:hypothetical protein CDL15_Pgr007069 [Punica granatum]|uniref:Uncharacterized protein n=1 Tax=Punica granatum TaxID=22663 RepID=A0A218X8A4_PUNGR|nr:hypothetical protein CDL15_Pgr007069 [Punica granatum]
MDRDRHLNFNEGHITMRENIRRKRRRRKKKKKKKDMAMPMVVSPDTPPPKARSARPGPSKHRDGPHRATLVLAQNTQPGDYT